jgi:hypothetical protein
MFKELNKWAAPLPRRKSQLYQTENRNAKKNRNEVMNASTGSLSKLLIDNNAFCIVQRATAQSKTGLCCCSCTMQNELLVINKFPYPRIANELAGGFYFYATIRERRSPSIARRRGHHGTRRF